MRLLTIAFVVRIINIPAYFLYELKDALNQQY